MALSVLVVDDSDIARTKIVKTLKLSGVNLGEIREAENGQIALDRLGQHWIDLVFLDINMPVMGGVELLERMRSEPTTKDTPVIIVSSEGSETRLAQLREKGVVGIVRKPYTPEALQNVIRDAVGKFDER
jgi:two-component system chemotaxis response regulator CheY